MPNIFQREQSWQLCKYGRIIIFCDNFWAQQIKHVVSFCHVSKWCWNTNIIQTKIGFKFKDQIPVEQFQAMVPLEIMFDFIIYDKNNITK